ncbi:MAG TPA: sensor domain-containing diguanylate cyclase [Terriglobales bacterium]|nr:sensor domain-containing diguanylate cyclase [Terriglobales bacterium]
MVELQGPEIYRIVLEGLHVGICLEDRQRKIVFWNDGAERITGYQRHEVVGHTTQSSVLAECVGQSCVLCANSCPFVQTMHEGKAREARIQIRHKAGHRVPVRVSVTPIRDSHGSVIGAATSFDEQKFALERDRRQQNFATHGCLDPATGAPNHGFTQFHLREHLDGFTEYHLAFAVLRVQVDQFHEFRLKYGPDASDGILRVVAQTLQNSLRPSDFMGRWGDDEFLAILSNCTQAGVLQAADRIRKVVGQAGINWWGDHLSATVSIGVAAAQSEDTIELLLGRAERSLEQIKAKRLAAAASSHAGGQAGA